MTEKEYSLILSRLRVPKGQAIVEVLNFGMDNHDLVIQSNAKGSKPIQFPQLAAGAHATKTIDAAAGEVHDVVLDSGAQGARDGRAADRDEVTGAGYW